MFYLKTLLIKTNSCLARTWVFWCSTWFIWVFAQGMGIHYTKRFAEENSIIFINSNRLKVNLCARGPDMQISRDRAIETVLNCARFWFLIAFHRATVFWGSRTRELCFGLPKFFSLGCVSVGSRRKETFVFIFIKKWNLIKKPVLLLLLLHEYLVNFECCLDQDLWVKSRALTSRHARLGFRNPFGENCNARNGLFNCKLH